MDGKGFFLGLIAAVVLFLLWKKETGPGMSFNFAGLVPGGNGAGSGCSGCAGGPGECAGCSSSPAFAAAPSVQGAIYQQGQITPGTPPLQTVIGAGSFYATAGPTPDSSFTNIPGTPVSVARTVARTQTQQNNVPSSPSTPANIVPTRAVGVVPSYPSLGFQQRYNIVGVPRTVLSTSLKGVVN